MEELYNRRYREIFETELRRGIHPGKPLVKSGKKTIREAKSTRLDVDYNKRVVSDHSFALEEDEMRAALV